MSDIISCFTAHFYLLQRMRAIFGCVHLNEFCESCSKQQQQQQTQRMKRKEGKRSTRVKKLVSLSSEQFFLPFLTSSFSLYLPLTM